MKPDEPLLERMQSRSTDDQKQQEEKIEAL
jgi:hypothetical protein